MRSSFSYDGKLVCLPKDTSTLALAVNTDLWKKAGLTENDYPTTWADLKAVAGKLTKGGVTGLVTTNEYQRLGVFMKQAGGWVTNPDQSKMTSDSPTERRRTRLRTVAAEVGCAEVRAAGRHQLGRRPSARARPP